MLIIFIESNIANEIYNYCSFTKETTVITQICIHHFQGYVPLFDMRKISIQYLWILVYRNFKIN